MAFTHGLDADFYLSGTDISGYLTEVDPNFERALAELGHLGDSWVAQLPGLRVGSVSLSGDYDNTLDDLVWSVFDASSGTAAIYYPEGSGTGDKYEMTVFCPSMKPGPASASDAVKYSFDLTCSGTVTRSAA